MKPEELRAAFEAETGHRIHGITPTLGYYGAYSSWLEAKICQQAPEQPLTECRNCGEMVQVIDPQSPHSMCPKCYC